MAREELEVMAKVVGGDSQVFKLCKGSTIADLRTKMSLSSDYSASDADGETLESSYELQDGDSVRFTANVKGGCS